jgi:hypothetical protein
MGQEILRQRHPAKIKFARGKSELDLKPAAFSWRKFFSGLNCGMANPRQRTVVSAVVVIAGIWVFAVAGYYLVQSFKVTADKVRAFAESVDLNKLSAADRARALKKLADELNALSLEERQQLRPGRVTDKWFTEMTEAEKEAFIEATMPTGIKQMLAAFEQQPEDRRRKIIDDALKRLRDQNANAASGNQANGGGTNRPPISPELEAKMRTVGLKSFYSQSSAETKAELAPLLEEMQRAMESGRMMRNPRQ